MVVLLPLVLCCCSESVDQLPSNGTHDAGIAFDTIDVNASTSEPIFDTTANDEGAQDARLEYNDSCLGYFEEGSKLKFHPYRFCKELEDDCILIEKNTCLMWSELHPVSGVPPILPEESKRNYFEANNHCSNLVFDNFADWRLPTFDELKSVNLIRNMRGKYSSSPPEIKEFMQIYGSLEHDWISSSPQESAPEKFVLVRNSIGGKRGAERKETSDDKYHFLCVRQMVK